VLETVVLICAAFAAGVLNTVAGGGTFLTFPALVAVGVPPVIANATSAVAVLPGYLGGAVGFKAELAAFDRPRLIRLGLIALAGAAVGAGLLLVSSNDAFSAVVPFLLLRAARTAPAQTARQGIDRRHRVRHERRVFLAPHRSRIGPIKPRE